MPFHVPTFGVRLPCRRVNMRPQQVGSCASHIGSGKPLLCACTRLVSTAKPSWSCALLAISFCTTNEPQHTCEDQPGRD